MSQPLLFISHKHCDGGIANVIGAFVESRSGGRVKVHLSSSPEFEGPKYGASLNGQLREALRNTEVLILVYTSADQDWSYCMWECGVATHSRCPETRIVVFQCGSSVPTPFGDVRRVNVREMSDIQGFAEQFLRDEAFFPRLGEALAPGLRDVYVEEAARELHQKLAAVLPPLEDAAEEEWPIWPFLQLELPRAEVDHLESLPERERARAAAGVVKELGEIVAKNPQALHLFGQAACPRRLKVSTLLDAWQCRHPDQEAAWFASCCEQMVMGAARGFPVIRRTSVRQPGSRAEYTPILTRVRRVPFRGCVQFDFYFYNLSDPRGVPVSAGMVQVGKIFAKNLEQSPPETVTLVSVIEELEARRFNRLPLLDGEGRPLYIVHRSMIDRFIVQQVRAPDRRCPGELTLADLLADDEMREMFRSTFAVVRREATVAEARSAMLARPGCGDVFVTAGGEACEPVVGWLTDVDLERAA